MIREKADIFRPPSVRSSGLSGFVYGANVGWISLSNGSAFVQPDIITSGTDSDGNGLPDAWERQYFGVVGVNPNADPDGDGLSNFQGVPPLDWRGIGC